MLRRRLVVPSLGLVFLAALGIAGAQNAYTARPMNLRAGPDRGYPVVAPVDEGSPLDVHGCLDGWSWCDVSVEGNRGWLYGGGIYFEEGGNDVWLYSYGPQVSLPIVTFSVDTYWGQYYQGRPWYGQREQWAHRHFASPPRLARPSGSPPHGPRAAGGSHAMSHSRTPAPARSGGEMRGHAMTHGHAAPERHTSPARHAAPQEHAAPQGHATEGHSAPAGRGPPKGGHAQRPSSSKGTQHGGSEHKKSEDQPRNPP
jgi:uncharacterized protein YraI